MKKIITLTTKILCFLDTNVSDDKKLSLSMLTKKYTSLFLFFSYFVALSQSYPQQNINLLGHIDPNTNITGIAQDGSKYSGCWGWHQSAKGKEYAISGSSIGTYFIDITNPTTPTVCAFVGGRPNCTWREIKTYQNYCYVSSDDFAPNRFQIIDMQYLPDSVHVVHSGTTYFERAHTLWIDGDKLYAMNVTYTNVVNNSYYATSPMNVYSLATPTAPLLLRELKQDASFITTVHDMHSRNDTVFASCGYQGLYIFKFNTTSNTFTQLGSYTGYTGTAYNHSSFLTQNGKYLLFCDEVPDKLPIRIIDVQNMSNIQPVSSFKPYTTTTPHNPYLIGNDLAILSCYQDGLVVYNISSPASPILTGFFDTYPQGGGNLNNYWGAVYRGNWGAYPYLPSGNIIASDMQNGIFILDANAAYTNTNSVSNALPNSVKKNAFINVNFIVYPNPASDRVALSFNSNEPCLFKVYSYIGELVFEKKYSNGINDYFSVDKLENGVYTLSVTDESQTTSIKKLIINH